MTQYFKNLGEQLLDQGYLIVPLPPGSKGPRLKGWPSLKLDKPTFHKMAANGSADAGIGVLARYTPAIDVDILDEAAAQEMSDLIDEIFPGEALMTRTGRAPKFLIPFRSDDPFKKLTSNVYTDGTNDHKVEILGDGQQWVAYHVHPGTLQPYYWFDGISSAGIHAVAHVDLPVLTRDDAQRVIDAFEVLAANRVKSGAWRLASGRLEDTVARAALPDSNDPFAAHIEPVGKSETEVEALLARHPNDEADYDHWFQVLAAVHHELGEAGEDIARAWSANAHKHTDEKFDLTWNSLGRYTGRQVTLRSLLRSLLKSAEPQHKPRAKSDNPFAVHAWGDYKQNYLSVPWIIKGVLPQAEVGILYGQSGSGKTFFVLDLAATVARGADWRGRKVSECRVVYVAAEAREGVKKRMDAYDQHVCPDGARPDIIASAPNLLSSDTQQLADAIGQAGLIILDTMAASHSGDENSAKDMGLFLAACKDLSLATGAMVLAVHHTGKEDSKGMRGSSALFAGADFVMEVFKNDKEHGAVLSKSRDDATGSSFSFVLKRVVVGHDDEGDEVTTCVVEPIKKDVEKTGKRPSKLANLNDSRYDLSREVLAVIEDELHKSTTGKVHQDKIFEILLDKYPGKQKKNMAVVLLRLEQMGAIRQSLDCYSLDDSEDFLG
jgi:RecA-family ATPase